ITRRAVQYEFYNDICGLSDVTCYVQSGARRSAISQRKRLRYLRQACGHDRPQAAAADVLRPPVHHEPSRSCRVVHHAILRRQTASEEGSISGERALEARLSDL